MARELSQDLAPLLERRRVLGVDGVRELDRDRERGLVADRPDADDTATI